MDFEETVHLLLSKTRNRICLDHQLVGFGDYSFVFRDINWVSETVDSSYTSGLVGLDQLVIYYKLLVKINISC